ncbi:AAA family ATPase [Conexibacter sp. W3-3-2]|uniref:ATP-binding protein n=1 Tax=Conexibacter sp. W3-3-2 TaxID=2675227 RepID=UPI0012B88069|nr:ATP-binding protein [Conexibacter sp. W3-3-2]MTD44561.1 AAA family ATPase [Conexibacter sp. W3-3-2]
MADLLHAAVAELEDAPQPAAFPLAYVEQALTVTTDEGQLGIYERIGVMLDLLELDELDAAILVGVLLPELHPLFVQQIAWFSSDAGTRPTPRLLARLLATGPLRDADVLLRLDRHGRLQDLGAVRLVGTGPLADRPLEPASPIVAWLLGSDLRAGGPTVRRIDPPSYAIGREAAQAAMTAAIRRGTPCWSIVGGHDAPFVLAAALGGVLVTQMADVVEQPAWSEFLLTARLEQRIPVVGEQEGREIDAVDTERLRSPPTCVVLWASRFRSLPSGLRATADPILVPSATPAERAACLETLIGKTDELQRVSLELSVIAEAVEEARGVGGEVDRGALGRQLRRETHAQLQEIAHMLEPGPGWSDLVLAPGQTEALELVDAFLRFGAEVRERWGLGDVAGRDGLVVLFAGESGTGKTMSARVVASGADLPLFRVDLSTLFSKWVGETEKNLDRIFDAADASQAVLFFDEGDVVFGRRTASDDAQSRYTNLATAHLLQRIEHFRGVVIIATNLRSNIDSAFLRRVDVLIDFPPPNSESRQELWERLLPTALPRGEALDVEFLARSFDLTGGGIRNAIMAGALSAAADGEAVSTAHLVRGVANEYTKLGRLIVEADFGPYTRSLRRAGRA